ncbi:MFS transporter [Flavobacterium psychrotrophum]|uniref:MFS transporter n=1 Tax=Flavobacterium psychrotrophum TaxID=2294119 RepID=UPI000E317A6A|nr:MFS transporter [Flavobacterium psychrotrophum]
MTTSIRPDKTTQKTFISAWVLGLLFYALEYAVRSAPSIMIPELGIAFALPTAAVSGLIGMYYVTYSVISLAAGLLIDRMGAKNPLIAGTVILGIGCILFAVSDVYAGYTGRLLQGMGSAIAFPACVYLAVRAFSPKHLATAIGATQSLGMLGGSAGQFISAPLFKNGLGLAAFWIIIGVLSLIIGGFVFGKTPKDKIVPVSKSNTSILLPYKIVFSNIQSYMCGLVSGLLFAPTTVFAMTWGVAFFQSGRGLDYTAATITWAIVPIGWAIGCPLMGWLADKTGSRKKVLALGASIMALSLLQLAYFPTLLHPYITPLILGIASGVAMLPYAIIKEVNPDWVKGSATGAINFITFGVTSLLGPLFSYIYGNSLLTTANKEAHFAGAVLFFVFGILTALLLTIFLRETGHKK